MRNRQKPIKEIEIQAKLGRRTVLLLEPVSFSGIEERELNETCCTLKTAQPDGKTSCKETSCETLEDRVCAQKCDNFAVGLRRKKLSKIAKAIL